MPKTVYASCVECLKDQEGKMTVDSLKTLIMMKIGGCDRTILQALHVMEQTGLIQDIGNGKIKVIRWHSVGDGSYFGA